jgi:hypothetical protein
MKLPFSHFVAAILAALSFLAGCSSDNPAPTNTGGASSGGASGSAGSSAVGAAGSSAGFTLLKNLIPISCSGSSCHDLKDHYLHLGVDNLDMLYATLTTYTTKTCGKLVNVANPPESALVKLLQGDCNGVVRMPYGKCLADTTDPFYDASMCISPDTIAQIQQWIAMGAPR